MIKTRHWHITFHQKQRKERINRLTMKLLLFVYVESANIHTVWTHYSSFTVTVFAAQQILPAHCTFFHNEAIFNFLFSKKILCWEHKHMFGESSWNIDTSLTNQHEQPARPQSKHQGVDEKIWEVSKGKHLKYWGVSFDKDSVREFHLFSGDQPVKLSYEKANPDQLLHWKCFSWHLHRTNRLFG